MKRFFGFASMLALLSAHAFARNTKPQTVIIPEAVQVGSNQLAAGTYMLAWTASTGSEGEVTLTRGGKNVITFAAKAVVEKTNPGVDTFTNGGVKTLTAINLNNLSLQVDGAPHPGQ
jgi:phage tail sheath gpL-like